MRQRLSATTKRRIGENAASIVNGFHEGSLELCYRFRTTEEIIVEHVVMEVIAARDRSKRMKSMIEIEEDAVDAERRKKTF